MVGVVIADGICSTENCPSDHFKILYWLDRETIDLECKVCGANFLYDISGPVVEED